ncbi:haloacid dehalogenase-like hydrolase [Nocardia vinacea]|uniref:Haloacid dehalogenase-like hydrolase n=1 Tax=Nocardia vinacea TaxID=96468 RepID=A0ABZ1YS47_9NOCA|nr:HAD family hydrolase [Nocardia vinacea]
MTTHDQTETDARLTWQRTAPAGDPLPSWRDSVSKQEVVDFVDRVTTEGGPDEVPPEDRIAVFDNDGTLWCEKPMPIQLDFVLRRLVVMAEQDEALRTRQPWQAAYTKDYGWLNDVITKHYHGDDSQLKVLAAGVLAAFAETSVEEFEAHADTFLRTARHPTLDRDYLACSYAPMVELLKYLAANGFHNYIVSGGGRDFMRPISQDVYGIPRQRVIGSGVSLAWKDDGYSGTIVREPKADVFDDGPEKPVQIWNRVGRRPLLAAGNSNGDIPMLQSSEQPNRPALRLLLLHDDPDREFDYVAGAEQALQLARNNGWTVVGIKDDWTTVF